MGYFIRDTLSIKASNFVFFFNFGWRQALKKADTLKKL